MASGGIVPSFDEREDRHASLSLGAERPALEQFAFERGEETLAHGVVVGIADRPHAWPNLCFLAPQPIGYGRVLRTLVRMMDDIVSEFRTFLTYPPHKADYVADKDCGKMRKILRRNK